MHLLAVIKFPKWAIKAINSQMSHFLWNDTDDDRKKENTKQNLHHTPFEQVPGKNI